MLFINGLPLILWLALALAAHALPITFRVRADRLEAAGRLQVGLDQLLVRGSFNNWSGVSGLLSPGPVPGEHAVTLDIPAGWHEWKFVLRHTDGCEEWEGLDGNRGAWLSASPAPVWFANDSSAVLDPLPVDLHFSVEMAQARRMGHYDPAVHRVGIVGSDPVLGCWSQPVELAVDGDVASGWLRHPALSSQVLEWKAVLWDPATPGSLLWEDGANRTLQRSGLEADALPPPLGDGVVELELPICWWSQLQGWEPGAVVWGGDFSMLPRLQAAGAHWWKDGMAQDPAQLFHQGGWSLARLRLWHTPPDPWHGLDSTVTHAQRLVQAGFDLLLDLHYSDSWADPGHQQIPAAWADLDLPALTDSVRCYTRDVLQHLASAGVTPRWVQLGNEIDAGLLWPTGRVDGAWNQPSQWGQLGQLLVAASHGVDEALPVDRRPQRMIHLANSGDTAACLRMLDSLTAHGLAFEAIGLSYYPWWQGSPDQLQQSLDALAERYGKELLLVECAYPFSLSWSDGTANIVGLESQLVTGFPATPEGQSAFFNMLHARLQAVPNGLGRAVLLWEPGWIPAPAVDNPWENLALFDFDGQALPALDLPAWLQPGAPKVQVASTPALQLRLWWEAVPGAGAYRIEWAPSLGSPWTVLGECAGEAWLSPLAGSQGFYRVRSLGARR